MILPRITLKYAQTLDGKIAAGNGSSRWISGKASLLFAHKLRARHDAVLVGVGTIIKDNPTLTTRLVRGKNPVRVVVDTNLRIPLNAKVLRDGKRAKTIIATTGKAPKKKIEKLKRGNIEIIIARPSGNNKVNLKDVFRKLYKKGLKSVLVEGGSEIITSVLRKRLADKIVVIVAAKILGSGKNAVQDLGITNIKDALTLKVKEITKNGEDIIYKASAKAK